jgi:hypothetical protein
MSLDLPAIMGANVDVHADHAAVAPDQLEQRGGVDL